MIKSPYNISFSSNLISSNLISSHLISSHLFSSFISVLVLTMPLTLNLTLSTGSYLSYFFSASSFFDSSPFILFISLNLLPLPSFSVPHYSHSYLSFSSPFVFYTLFLLVLQSCQNLINNFICLYSQCSTNSLSLSSCLGTDFEGHYPLWGGISSCWLDRGRKKSY